MQFPEIKSLNFLAVMTFIVVTGYMSASIYALLASTLSYQDFSAAIGPLAGMLLGYWVRDTKTNDQDTKA